MMVRVVKQAVKLKIGYCFGSQSASNRTSTMTLSTTTVVLPPNYDTLSALNGTPSSLPALAKLSSLRTGKECHLRNGSSLYLLQINSCDLGSSSSITLKESTINGHQQQ